MLSDVVDEVDDTVGVTVFVVIPTDELDKVRVESDAGSGVEDGRVSGGGEIGGDDLIFGVVQNSGKLSFGGGLDNLLDLVQWGWLLSADGQVDNGDIWGWNTEGHTGEFSVKFGDNLKEKILEKV